MKSFCLTVIALAILSPTFAAQAGSDRTSGLYPTSIDYRNGQMGFEGTCGSKSHKLELHDVLDKPYIDLTHRAQKQRISKALLFGFHGCDGYDYRFASNLEYRIVEEREAYVYLRETYRAKLGTVSRYYFSAGPDGQLLPLTAANLKQAFPQNQILRASLDLTLDTHQKLEQYDKDHEMFEVNYLLKASHAQGLDKSQTTTMP